MAWNDMSVELVGEAPGLILHNVRLSNPLDSVVKAIKAITGKRDKTDADYAEIAHLSFLGSLYLDQEDRVIIPDRMIEGCFVAGAKKTRSGPAAKSGFFAKGNSRLIYDGPQTPEDLWSDGTTPFVFTVMVVIQKVRVERTRPLFHEWSLTTEVSYDDEALNRAKVLEIFTTAGKSCGIGDWRPKYGRFTAREV